MNIVQLSDSLAVSGQIRPEDLREIATAGYAIVVNNRPDGEEGGQPASAEMEAVARELGLEYHHMPVTAMDFPGPDFDAFSDLLDNPQQPVFAFCRSGTRCTNLWVSSREADELDAALSTAQRLGYDLGMAAHYLARK
ncbi:MAG: TIGR01244 family sulfur transferase [Halioglobus sp.]